jgi:hypothetical protein
LQEHIKFGFNHNGEYRYLGFVYYDNEAMYIKIDTGRKANLYFDIKDTHFELKALRNIRAYKPLVINPTANHSYTF